MREALEANEPQQIRIGTALRPRVVESKKA
jgi:hypothetical protein